MDAEETSTTIAKIIEASRIKSIPKENLPPDCHPEKLLKLLSECDDCNIVRRDPHPEELYLFLHAYEYAWDDFKVSTSQPHWVNDNFVESEAIHLVEQLREQKKDLEARQNLTK